MNHLRGIATSLVIVPAIIVFLLHGFLICLMRDPLRRRRLLIKNVSRYSRFGLFIMRVRTDVRGLDSLLESPKNFLMVCNHLSYLDMMVLAAIRPAAFVTSVDMGQVFFLGRMTKIGGSLFVERRHRARLSHDIHQLQEALIHGFDVMLFPEGTSSDGSDVLPFKRSLLASAAHSGCPILPVTIKYPRHREVVCWYGSQGFAPHFFRLLSAKSVEAKVMFHRPVEMHDQEAKHEVADRLHDTISKEYKSHGGEVYGVYQYG